ncbi:hypothetical protein BDQ17DRAFT_1540378 [Cyathus striatus]|nr:hypothetical protein BDQ17DRAFT_1540378 [Cyathus striatus]
MLIHKRIYNKKGAGSYTGSLPLELIFEISRHLSYDDLKNLAYASRNCFWLIQPVPDTNESWTSNCESFEECETRLDDVLNNPCVGAYVQRLILKPSCNIAKPTPEILRRERKLGQTLTLVLPHMPLLHTFLWDGFETLDEDVWTILHESCPKIRYIGTSVGALGSDNNSKLFSFSNLLGFRYFSKWQEKPLPSTFDEDINSLPDPMWEMLLRRCSQLHALEIGGQGSSLNTQLFDVRPLTNGRWPALRELTLGNTLMMNRSAENFVEEKYTMSQAFTTFLTFHDSLEKLHLPHCCRFPPVDLHSSPFLLKSFKGTFHYFHHFILPVAEELEELILCDEEHGAWYMPFIRPVFRTLQSLRRLVINIDLSVQLEDDPVDSESRETDHMVIFRHILSDCLQLEHISFICSTQQASNFAMEDLPQALIDKPANLKSIEVLKMDNKKEQCKFWTVASMLRQCPSLNSIKLRYTCDTWRYWRPEEIRHEGTFSVQRNSETGYPRTLQATETEVRSNGDRVIRQCFYPLPTFKKYVDSGSMLQRAKKEARKTVFNGVIWAMVHGGYGQKGKTIRSDWQRRDPGSF